MRNNRPPKFKQCLITTIRSCLLHRFVKSEWRILSSQTIGVEFASKIVKIGTGPSRRRVKLQLWDTAGTERFRAVSRSYYRGAAGAVLVYDVASIMSFNALPTFLMDAKALASPNLAVILAGNKVDLSDAQSQQEPAPNPSSTSSRQSSFLTDGVGSARSVIPGSRWTATKPGEGREVQQDIATRWASKSGIPVVTEVSALSGENVDELFNRLARMILTKIELGEVDPDDPQSGIQYGEMGDWDGNSIRSGVNLDDTVRRRKKGKNIVMNGISEFGDVFRKRGARGCC